MVNQGAIIFIDLNPTKGHEQGGRRPVVVISNSEFYRRTKMTIVLPITNNEKAFPLHVPLDSRTKVTGKILCEHIRSIDLSERSYEEVEHLPSDLLERVLAIVSAEVEKEE